MNKRECLKNKEIGQSAAKALTGQGSSTIPTGSTLTEGKRGVSIYALLDKKGNVRYVGQTIQTLHRRLQGHKHDAKRKRHHTANWIKKNIDSIAIKLIKIYPRRLAKYAEYYWMKYYSCMGAKLTNTCIPTDPGMLGIKHSEKAKKLIAKAASEKV